MMRIILLGVALALATAASAQLYRWVDQDGRVHYTSTPPPSDVQSRSIAGPSPSAPAADKVESKGPLTPADREQAFQKRRLEEQTAAEKAAAAAKDDATKQQNCQRAKEWLATLESGQRIRRTDEKGEQYYLEDNARAAEIQSARSAVQDWCN